MTTSRCELFFLCCVSALGGVLGCGDGDATGGDPTEVTLGETAFVTIVNPAVNEANDTTVPAPGANQVDVLVDVDQGPAVHTGTDGVAVLAPVEAGSRTLAVSGGGMDGSLVEGVAEGDLVELAIAGEGDRVERMARVVYAFGAQVVELSADTPVEEVNDALSNSDQIVLLAGGTYEGDLEFSGSNVTLFGEGVGGGQVFIDGNVEVGGSDNRIRGATITGDLDVSGSDFGMSFSRIEGEVILSGSGVTLLRSDFCGSVDISGSELVALGNGGLAPLDHPSECP